MSDRLDNVTFAALDEMDHGRLSKLLARHLATLSNDCMNRPDDTTPRKLTIELVMKPTMDKETRECERVWTEIEMKSKVPVYRSAPIPMRPHKSGFFFNKDIPEDLDAQSLFRDQGAD